MRFLFLVFLILIANVTVGQTLLDRKISIVFENSTIEQCLNSITKQESIYFSFNSKAIHSATRITASFKEDLLATILDEILKNSDLTYTQLGGQISIYKNENSTELVTISGYIRDEKSKEEIAGARLYFKDYGIGCVTNAYGYYAIKIPTGKSSLQISSVGMATKTLALTLENDLVINISLSEDTLILGKVEILHKEHEFLDLQTSDLSSVNGSILTSKKLKRIPPANGEFDLVKYAQQFPGIQPSTGGTANYQVRGSSSGNNLLLIDEIPIYHPTHLLGIYSVINSDAIKSAQLYKDYIPAKYGYRNSSILQIRTNEGNQTAFHLTGGISFLSLRANLEGPIVKDVASFYISARRSSMPDIFSGYLYQNQIGLPDFYDINLKLNYKLNTNNRVYVTGYFGSDEVNNSDNSFNWGNAASSIRWNHTFNQRTFSNLTGIISAFNYSVNSYQFLAKPLTQNILWPQLKYDFTTYLSNKVTLSYGINTGFMLTTTKKSTENAELFLNRKMSDNAVYFSLNKRLKSNLELEIGARVPIAFHIGNQDSTTYLNSDYTTTTVVYEKNKGYDLSVFLDPRVLLTYYPTATSKWEMALNVTTQNTHIINYNNNFIPIQLWTNSSSFLPAEHNYQVSAGYTKKFPKSSLTGNVFGKFVQNAIDFATPNFTESSNIESNLISGHILATGFESMFQFELGSIYAASLGYSFLHARQKTPGVNFDTYYPTLNNRPHYFTFTQYLSLSKKWELSSNFIWHSRTSVTVPNGQIIINNVAYPLFSESRNSEQLPYYARLDISITRKLGIKKKRDNFWLIFNCQNILGRYNPSIIYLNPSPTVPGQLDLVSTDFSPSIITGTLNFKF